MDASRWDIKNRRGNKAGVTEQRHGRVAVTDPERRKSSGRLGVSMSSRPEPAGWFHQIILTLEGRRENLPTTLLHLVVLVTRRSSSAGDPISNPGQHNWDDRTVRLLTAWMDQSGTGGDRWEVPHR